MPSVSNASMSSTRKSSVSSRSISRGTRSTSKSNSKSSTKSKTVSTSSASNENSRGRKTKSKRVETVSNSNARPQTTTKKNYTVHHALYDFIPKELIREVTGYLNREEQVMVGKTPWMNNFPLIEYLYQYDSEDSYSGYDSLENEPYTIEDKEILMDPSVKVKLEKCIVRHILKNLGKKKNKTLDILPQDVKRILVTIHMSPRKKKSGENYQDMMYSPDSTRGDTIYIYPVRSSPNYGKNPRPKFKYYAYNVNIHSVDVEMKNTDKKFPDVSTVNCSKPFKLRMFAYI